jgi:hypothetical protein
VTHLAAALFFTLILAAMILILRRTVIDNLPEIVSALAGQGVARPAPKVTVRVSVPRSRRHAAA